MSARSDSPAQLHVTTQIWWRTAQGPAPGLTTAAAALLTKLKVKLARGLGRPEPHRVHAVVLVTGNGTVVRHGVNRLQSKSHYSCIQLQ